MAVKGRSFLVTKRSRLARVVGVLALLAALAFLAGCGGGGNKSSSGSTSSGSNSGKTYPVLRVAWDAPDYMDPALYYTVAAYQVDNYVWTGLLGPSGALLSVFMTILLLVILDSFDRTRWLAGVMTAGGEDTVDPVEPVGTGATVEPVPTGATVDGKTTA